MAAGRAQLFQGHALIVHDSVCLLKLFSGFGNGLRLLACLHIKHGSDPCEQGNSREPLHHLMYGTGIQNFECSQEYAIRFPVFLSIFAPAVPLKFLPFLKSSLFFWVRYTFAVVGRKSSISMTTTAKRPVEG
mmetsp:Transcript_133254/g.198223  ORF Transcript_133254/g.198223 Transcript_133254/m.198223 type:complete len:132 (-) Transcript_133254:322-717(-)